MPLTSSRKPSPLSCHKGSILGFRPVRLAALALAALSPSAFCQTQTPIQAPASPKPAATLLAKAASNAATDPGQLLMSNPSSAGIPSNWQVQASSLSGEVFAPKQLQGRVAVVFYWSTNCAVCRDTLPELRSNLEGWRKKPVAVVQVNVDKQAADWRSYEQIRNVMHKPVPGLFSLRMDAGLSPTKLPLTLVVDAQNRVVRRYEGRIAPEAWNDVADLLP